MRDIRFTRQYLFGSEEVQENVRLVLRPTIGFNTDHTLSQIGELAVITYTWGHNLLWMIST